MSHPTDPHSVNDLLLHAQTLQEVLKWVILVLMGTIVVLVGAILRLWSTLDKRTERFTRIMAIAVSTLKDLGVTVKETPQ